MVARGARLLLGLLFVALVAPGATLAGSPQIKLALLPVGQAASFFDLTMRPGDARTLQVDVANDGDATLAVRTYASDVYTIINGGFGGRLRDTPRTGMTTWLDYPDEVVVLPVGKPIRRTFGIRVPATATPGEYIAGLVLENDQPIPQSGAVSFGQIMRQAVGVVVTVPGPRLPALAIGAASHEVVAGTSIVSIAVENTGNVRLKPVAKFTIFDAAGIPIGHATVQMDTFYARTGTFVEMPLSSPLAPGNYTVRLNLSDKASGAAADDAAIPLEVAGPAAAVDDGLVPGLMVAVDGAGMIPGLNVVSDGAGQSQVSLATVVSLMLMTALVVIALACLRTLGRRRHLRGRSPITR